MSKRDIRLMIEDVKFGSRGVGVLKKNNKNHFYQAYVRYMNIN